MDLSPGNKSRRPQKLSSVTLQEDLQLLDEVVVVGYTTIKAKRVTGAISDIRNKELMQSTATKTTSALMGKWQELQPVTSGGPGAGANIEIRNLGTPLFIIDGIQKIRDNLITWTLLTLSPLPCSKMHQQVFTESKHLME